jgi:hypothetical protein
MDNQPRLLETTHQAFSHGHQTWIDTCLQQILSAQLLLKMATVLGRVSDVEELKQETDRLTQVVNEQLWDDESAFYYDRRPNGDLSDVKTIGAYWALLADVVAQDRLARFIGHLQNPREFNRPHRVPSLSADHPEYDRSGGYWLGGVWPPTNYMVLRGLSQTGYDALAHEIAANHLANVVQVFERTGTVWENYAPESPSPGKPAKGDFVGWGGLSPISVLFEYVFGLRPDVPNSRLVWDVRLLEGHGIAQYPFGEVGLLDLDCAARSSYKEKPAIKAVSNIPLQLEVRWKDGRECMDLGPDDELVQAMPSKSQGKRGEVMVSNQSEIL